MTKLNDLQLILLAAAAQREDGSLLPPPSKTDHVLTLLHREQGASMDELVATTGWLPHSTRAALTGLRKKGYAITLDKTGVRPCYRIVGGDAASRSINVSMR